VDLVDWLQNEVSLEGHSLRLKRKRKSKMSMYPNFVAVLHVALFCEFPSGPERSVRR